MCYLCEPPVEQCGREGGSDVFQYLHNILVRGLKVAMMGLGDNGSPH